MKKHLYYLYWLIRTRPMRWQFPKYNILSFEDTVNEIVSNRKSISRFGDGEFRLLTKERGIYFQKLDNTIAERLNGVLNANLPNHLVCIPSAFITQNNMKRGVKVHWLSFVNQKGKEIANKMSCHKTYGDALISRFYMDYEDKSATLQKVKKLKQIWEDQEVLFVEGEFSRLGIGNDFFTNAKSIERILCPSNDAFEKYEEILSAAKKFGRNKLIIIALGPSATILAHDLAEENYWALDLGHIDIEYSWFLQNAQCKIAVKGKKSAEFNKKESYELTQQEMSMYNNGVLSHIA